MKKISLLTIASFLSVSSFSQAMNLEEFLTQVRAKHKTVEALQNSMKAADYRKEKGNLELSPVLSLTNAYLDDQKQSASVPTYIITRNKTSSYSLGLSQQFATGTKASMIASANQTNINALNSMAPTQQAIGTSGLGVSLSQSLWKNFFGEATRIRQSLDEQTSKMEKTGYELQLKQLLIEAEAAYWDYIYIQDEFRQRQDSMERAKKIESWIQKRVSNGIGDQADLLGAQSLVAQRQLQLLMTKDEEQALRRKVSNMLELSESEQLPKFENKLSSQRPLPKMIESFHGSGKIVRLDSYLSVLEEKAKSLGARQADDAMKPDLQLSGSYSTNQYNPDFSTAVSNITNTNTPTTQVAITLNWMLDSDVKKATRESARMDALAAALKKERQLLESQTAWAEINRRNLELTKKIEAAKILTDLQKKKAAVEKNKLERGRTVTSNVITAEQEAAESELNLTKMMVEQRKLEAQARMFINVGESL